MIKTEKKEDQKSEDETLILHGVLNIISVSVGL